MPPSLRYGERGGGGGGMSHHVLRFCVPRYAMHHMHHFFMLIHSNLKLMAGGYGGAATALRGKRA